MRYVNAPSSVIGSVVSSGLASLAELATVLSLEDAYLLLEIARIDSYNNRPRK